MKLFGTLLGLSLAASAITGCSSSDDDPYATVGTFCEAWGHAACSGTTVQNCSGMDHADDGLTNACVKSQQAFCEQLVPTAGYSSARAQQCLDAVSAAYSDGKLSAKEIDTVRHRGDPCNHLIKGPKGKDGSCDSDDDCDTLSDYVCVLKSGVGSCEIPMLVDNGTSCADPEASCNPGFYCGGDVGDENCVKSKSAGAKCTDTFQCETGLVCMGADADSNTSGTCEARVSQKKCTEDSDCTTNVCDIAAGSETGTCVSTVVLTPTDSLCEDLQ